MPNRLNREGLSHAEELIRRGDVDETSDWEFTPEDGDAILGDPPNWEEYRRWFLGVDPEADPETKAHYKYPFGKRGKLFRSAVRAIRTRAAQQGDEEISNAARDLLDQLDARKEREGAQAPAGVVGTDSELSRFFLAERPLALSRRALTQLIAAPHAEVLRGALFHELSEPVVAATEPSSIAVVQIRGVLVHRAGFLERLFGGQDYDSIGELLRRLAADETVGAIVLDIDSPGGEVDGLFDLVDTIAAIEKPVVAVANSAALSAAYAIASAADVIVVSQTGSVGSIGIIAEHVSFADWEKKNGIAVTEVIAGRHKADFSPHKPLSDDAREALQAEVDALYDIFVSVVAKHRGLSEDTVRATDAATYLAKDAVRIGLADRIGNLDNAVALAIDGAQRGVMAMRDLRIDAISEAAELSAKIEEAAREKAKLLAASATEAERKRVLEILKRCAAVRRLDLAQRLISEGLSPEAASEAIMVALATSHVPVNGNHGEVSPGQSLVRDAIRRAEEWRNRRWQ